MIRFQTLLTCVISFGVVPGLADEVSSISANETVRFSMDVAPIFRKRCLNCHNDVVKKGDVSLSTGTDLAGSGYIEIDDPDASHLLDLVTPRNGKAEMPKDAKALDKKEIAVLREWVKNGASWPAGIRLQPIVISDLNWWSLQPIVRPRSPASEAPNPVDAFIDTRLAKAGIKPVGQSRPQVLIRRLTYDLSGLPPTPTETAEFLKQYDRSPEKAWNDAVDRLLASPAFGEKWAQHWLDLARYAETHGYDKDKPRNNAWPYRDYVIRSFNEDKPYSRFVKEQVAGDVLFPDSSDGVLGLGFLAAGPWDFIGHWEVGEGKVDGRIAKHLDRDEMVSAVFNVFQSTTVQCAQCHHHKFDPIRMEDYYRLHAVFAAVDRADRVYRALTPEQQKRKTRMLADIDQLKKQQAAITNAINQKVNIEAVEIDRRMAELKKKFGTSNEPEPQYGFHSRITNNPRDEKWVQLDFGRPLDLGLVRLRPAFDNYAGIGAGFGFPVRYKVEASNDPEFEQEVEVLFDATVKDQPNPKTRPVDIRCDPVQQRLFRYVRMTATQLAERKNDYIFAIAEIETLDPDHSVNFARKAAVTSNDSIESGVRWGRRNINDGIYFRELNNDVALAELYDLYEQREAIVNSRRTPEVESRLKDIRVRVASLDRELKRFPSGDLVYAAATHFKNGGRFTATEGNPRPIHLLHRGDIGSPGQKMLPGSPALWANAPSEFFESDDWNEGAARAKLASYLARQDNPLVWRSIANRLWGWTFGIPIVSTPNDFGRSGTPPTHPELLEFLAARLRDDPNHSLKSIIRLLVTSDVYRRSSQTDPSAVKQDAGNALLWRSNRRRLTAEEFRDSLFFVSGVLRRDIGGPSFRDFVIEKPQHSPHYEYHMHQFDDARTHRRSIYRFVVRSQPHPLLTTLDCADPSISTPRRDESTTALQALASWNNRLVEYSSRKLGDRLEWDATTPKAQVELACRLALGRVPTELERPILVQHVKDYGTASLARVIFNMNAFVYID